MNIQEPQDEQQYSVDSELAMLHLNTSTTGIHHHNSTTEQQCHSCDSLKNQQPHFSPERTTLLPPISTTKTKKRYSNTRFSSSLEEPFPKRTATVSLLPTISTTSNDNNNNNNHLQGFIKLPLENHRNLETQAFLKPHQFETSTTPSPAKPPLPPPLYRTFSDPTGKRKSPTRPPHHTLARTTSWSPNESPFNNEESPSTTMKSPNYYALTRTASWSSNGESPTTMKSPNHCGLTRTASWSPNVQELGVSINNGQSPKSPTAMRLKRMKDGMREMRQWCDLMIQEEDVQEETEPEENKVVKDDETESGGEPLCEEAVWVERMGSCLILHFKCPCGKGYQILLSGNNCYYKLTNF